MNVNNAKTHIPIQTHNDDLFQNLEIDNASKKKTKSVIN